MTDHIKMDNERKIVMDEIAELQTKILNIITIEEYGEMAKNIPCELHFICN